ncbi:hypothetical protein ACOI9X_16105 [Pseudomonas sp. P2757]|uniref:hypothetical protein n=1 Tax=unclassified Pseudomonas TaxID=196821 RepID=UPI003B5C5C7C
MKRDIFSELMDGLEALAEERQKTVTADTNRERRIGAMKGDLAVPVGFDAPLPENLSNSFEGKN